MGKEEHAAMLIVDWCRCEDGLGISDLNSIQFYAFAVCLWLRRRGTMANQVLSWTRDCVPPRLNLTRVLNSSLYRKERGKGERGRSLALGRAECPSPPASKPLAI